MKPTLLIAEGDAILCDIYERYLSNHGYTVEVASDGLRCLEILRRCCPGALILDLDLRWGGSDGVLAWLREHRAAPGPAVVLTGTEDSFPAVADNAEPPVVKCLSKPFALTTLLETVRAVFAHKPHGQAFDVMVPPPGSEFFIG
jgi:DNA-binding response OmpR family regulator